MNKIFNKGSLLKILIIFIVNLFSRLLINYYLNVNVFTDSLNYISLIYYFIFSCFIIIIHNLVDNSSLFRINTNNLQTQNSGYKKIKGVINFFNNKKFFLSIINKKKFELLKKSINIIKKNT